MHRLVVTLERQNGRRHCVRHNRTVRLHNFASLLKKTLGERHVFVEESLIGIGRREDLRRVQRVIPLSQVPVVAFEEGFHGGAVSALELLIVDVDAGELSYKELVVFRLLVDTVWCLADLMQSVDGQEALEPIINTLLGFVTQEASLEFGDLGGLTNLIYFLRQVYLV